MEPPQPNTVFNWLEIVPISLIYFEAKRKFTIPYPQGDNTKLFDELKLKELRKKNKSYEKLFRKAMKVRTKVKFINSLNQFNQVFTGFLEVFNWLTNNVYIIDRQSVKSKISFYYILHRYNNQTTYIEI